MYDVFPVSHDNAIYYLISSHSHTEIKKKIILSMEWGQFLCYVRWNYDKVLQQKKEENLLKSYYTQR